MTQRAERQPDRFRTARRGGALLVALLGCAATAAAAPVSPSARFVSAPMELHLMAGAGNRAQASVEVTNTSTQPLALKLYLGDSRLEPDGRETELPPGEHPRSCAGWTVLRDQFLELAPGESKSARLELEVPVGSEGSYWTKLYIEEVSMPERSVREMGGRKYTVFMKQRLGIRLFEDVAGTGRLDAIVSEVAVQEDAPGVPRMVVGVTNPGTLIARCTGKIEVRNTSGTVVATVPLGSRGQFWVYPGNRRDLSAVAPGPLAPGTYTVLAIVDFGGDHLVAGDAVYRTAEATLRNAHEVAEDRP
jgi:hypothetical protein